ncbi:transcriptional repressor LexA [Thermobrachium celere]|uniref:LexA repressor n=1 Tax=Thermobrachium celere DSM 8682 TaxID=941824 RepID=R7RRS6_9CLOT|nr:transcriptional repressor LexA [Thermobrachium celere]CDF57983.1 SOS-response repressor and protease LexA [Thermobrachium celere DSM 8682]
MLINELTDKQQMILEFIKQELATKGYPPSVREIGLAVGLKSTSTVHAHLEKLEKKGYIRRDPTKPRAIEILDNNSYTYNNYNNIDIDILKAPIVGNVSAGNPILAFEDIQDYFPLPLSYFNANNEVFLLKIEGESMIEAGILDGDYVVVEKRSIANNGDIVVALIDDSATVKRFYREDNFIRLQPENSSMEPIIVKDCKIIGKVIGVIRRYK